MRGQRFFQGVAAAGLLAIAGVPAFGATYVDGSGDLHNPGDVHMDISSVEVTNDATNISFKVNVAAAAINSPDWAKYTIALDTIAGGNTAVDDGANPWGRSISMSSGMDYWFGSWVDGSGGGQLFQFSGGSWGPATSVTHSISGNSITLTTSLASLGLSNGSTFNFDVYTTGGNGGDGANDAAGKTVGNASAGWPDHYDSGANVLTYTVVVPEPATAGVLALGGLAVLARRRRA